MILKPRRTVPSGITNKHTNKHFFTAQHSIFQTLAAATTTWLPIALLLTLSLFLFTYQIGSEGLWLDELNSFEDVTELSVGDHLKSPVRPLYYFMLMAWMQLGNSDIWLRGLSVIFALMSVFLLYRIGHRLVGKTEGLIAALLLAMSPVVVNHAQEIRMYAVSLCLCLAGTLCLVDGLLVKEACKPKQRSIGGWMVFRLLAIYTVPLNVLLLLPDVLIIGVRFRRQRGVLISVAKWLLLLFLLWLPAISAVAQAAGPTSDYASHHSGEVAPGMAEIVRLFKFFTVWPFSVQNNALIALFYKVLTLFIMGLAGVGLSRGYRSPRLLWIGAWLVIPVVPIVAFSHMAMPIWKTRYLLFVSPYLFILLAAGLTRLWQQWRIRQWRIVAIALSAAYLIAATGGLFHHYTVQERADYKFNITTLETHERTGDGLVWSYECCESALKRYYDGQMKVYKNSVEGIETPAEIGQWLEQFPAGYERLWLVLDSLTKDKSRIERAIAKTYSIEIVFDYEQGSKVMLLKPLPNP